jgi:hypothetical protein
MFMICYGTKLGESVGSVLAAINPFFAKIKSFDCGIGAVKSLYTF